MSYSGRLVVLKTGNSARLAWAVVVALLIGCNHSRPTESPPAVQPRVAVPRAMVAEPTHNFGSMKVGETKWHVFVIRNEGKAELRLRLSEMSSLALTFPWPTV